MATEVARRSAADPRELLKAVQMLAAAWPRGSWGRESEAVYVAALAQARVSTGAALAAVSRLIREETDLPPVALVLRRCQEEAASGDLYDWSCPRCGSLRTAGTIGGPGLCFDCDTEFTFEEAR